jgi:ATP-dependent protease Clp ATPase subunit
MPQRAMATLNTSFKTGIPTWLRVVDVELAKSNILLIRPTGSEKTLLAQTKCGG